MSAYDRETNAAVTIKEARPHTGIDADGLDAVDRLKRQYRYPCRSFRIRASRPPPSTSFGNGSTCSWSKSGFAGSRWSNTRRRRAAVAGAWYPCQTGGVRDEFARSPPTSRRVSTRCTPADLLGPVTVADVVVTDLDADWVRVWNLDTARESGEGQTQADDMHVLGTLLADTLCPQSGALIRLDPSRAQPFLALGAGGIGLADTLEHTILRCLDTDRAQRPTAAEVLQVLGQSAGAGLAGAQSQPAVAPQPTLPDALQGTLQAAITALQTSADLRHPGRLFPADSLVLDQPAQPGVRCRGASGMRWPA